MWSVYNYLQPNGITIFGVVVHFRQSVVFIYQLDIMLMLENSILKVSQLAHNSQMEWRLELRMSQCHVQIK